MLNEEYIEQAEHQSVFNEKEVFFKKNNKEQIEEIKEGIFLEKNKGFEKIFLKHEKISIYPIENKTLNRLEGIRIQFFEIDQQKTYFKSNGDPVIGFPRNLYIDLDIFNLSKLVSVLLGGVSSYLYNIRSKVLHNNNYYKLIKVKKFINDKYLKVRLSKYFFRDKDKGRYKVSIAFVKESNIEEIDDTELINFNLTKRDILVLLSLIKKITSSYLKDAAIPISVQYIDKDTGEFLTEKTSIIGKIYNAIIIDGVWFHGQEILNMMYVAHDLINKLHVERELNNVQTNYRQIKFFAKEDILYLDIVKMNSNHELVYNEYDDKKVIIRIPIGAIFLAALFMYFDIEILRHTNFDSEYYEELGEDKLAQLLNHDSIKYHLSLKESYLGVGIKEDPNAENFANKTKIYFAGIAKEGKFFIEEDGEILKNYVLKYDKYNIGEPVPVMSQFHIDLRNKWPIFIKALSYGLTQEYLENGKEYDMNKFYVINKDLTGRYKYEFTIYSTKDNKAPIVLIIDKYKLDKDKEPKLEARFRQPLFRKYVYQLLSIFLAAGKDMHNLELTDNVPENKLLPYLYKSYKTVNKITSEKELEYGIKKSNNVVYWGAFKTKENKTKTKIGYSELPQQDIELLNISSEFRLFNAKRWIPFTGERITLTQNGYITDMFSEYNLEENNKGVFWAIRLYYGTNLKY